MSGVAPLDWECQTFRTGLGSRCSTLVVGLLMGILLLNAHVDFFGVTETVFDSGSGA